MLGVLVGLLCASTWACASVLLRDLSKKLDPFTINAPRSLIGGLTMFLFTLATGRTEGYQYVTLEKLFFLLASVSVGGGIGDSFYVLSLARIGVSRASPISSTYPALTLVLGLLFLQEEISLAIVAGLVLVIGGVLLISRPGSANRPSTKQGDKDRSPINTTGVIFALIASVCWAVSNVLIAPGIEGLDSIMVTSFRVPALSLILWGIVALRGTFPELLKLSRKEWLVLLIGGFIGWGLGSVLFLLSVSLLGPTRSAILNSTSPLFALPLSVIFLQEKVNGTVLIGTALTVLGVILIA